MCDGGVGVDDDHGSGELESKEHRGCGWVEIYHPFFVLGVV